MAISRDGGGENALAWVNRVYGEMGVFIVLALRFGSDMACMVVCMHLHSFEIM
jgi:hypothetical protein